MAKDYWPNLYEDSYTLKRIEKSVEIANVMPGMKVLDVGCHHGELEVYMPLESMYTGIDSLNGYEIDGGFEMKEKYDRIICLETLEHLKYPHRTLEAIKEHLKEDGFAVISLPNESTLFHRIRAFLGTPDSECFSENGKHLHLPNLYQARTFLSTFFKIEEETSYIIPSAVGCRQAWVLKLMRLIPERVWEFLAKKSPSLFARGWIFKCSLYNKR